MSVDAEGYLADRTPLVDAVLEGLLPVVGGGAVPDALAAAMRHLVFPGGKRLRPAFAMAAAEAVGGRPEQALPMAAAVELLHTYSLVHDDLPCMDDDAQRRGRPTVHVAFGESTAVLAGDALLTLAFEALTGESGDSPALRLQAAGDLARASGAAGLVGGQVDDLAYADFLARSRAGDDPLERAALEAYTLTIHRRKSAALIAVSIVGGARLAGAASALLTTLQHFGENVGVAFQVADDLLDAGEDEGCTLLHALDAETAQLRAETMMKEALDLVAPLGEAAEPLRALAGFAVRRKT